MVELVLQLEEVVSRYQRDKGKRAETEVASILRPLCPDVRTKRAGGESASVDRGRDLLGTPGLCVQVKGHARPFPLKALSEACSCALDAEIPVAICKEVRRGARSEWTATLRLADFLYLYEKGAEAGSQPGPGSRADRPQDSPTATDYTEGT